MKKIIESEIRKFYLEIKKVDTKDVSLIFGWSGILLFVSEYELLYDTKNKIAPKIFKEILQNVNNLEKISFSEGLGGVGWVLADYIEKQGKKPNYILQDFDEINEYYLVNMLRNADYDYLHGAIGVGNYFLKRKKSKQLNSILLSLIKNCKEDQEGIRWTSIFHGRNESFEVEELSLSHGCGAVLVLLCEMKKISKDAKIDRLMQQVIKYVKKYAKFDKENLHDSIFPTMIRPLQEKQDYGSRLAWCNGDLSIAYSLLKVSIALSDFDLYLYSIKIALNCAERKSKENSLIIDAELCHGSSGLYLLFEEFYEVTNVVKFKNASLFWLKKTLEFRNEKSYQCGYKFYGGHDEGWKSDISFLSGISGVGLAYLHYLNKKSQHTWKQTLLIY